MSVALHYETVGSGQPVLVLHGLFGSGRNWLSVARRLGSDYQFHLVDLRNHGRSPHDPAMTYQDMIHDVRRLVSELELEQFILVGHSMGGKAAMTMALNDPAGIARLINIDIAPVTYPDRFQQMIEAMRAVDLSTIHRRAEIEPLLEPAIPEKAVRQFIMQNLEFKQGVARWRANLAALHEQMPYILGPLPVAADATCDIDTWFIRGELSDRITAGEIPTIRQYFPNARIETVAGGGHWPHAEAPQAFMTLFSAALAAP